MMRKYQVRFGGGPTEKGSQDHLAGGLPNYLAAYMVSNDLGLFDMHGSAWCWCSDNYVGYWPGDDPRSLLGVLALLELTAAAREAQGLPGVVATLSGLMGRLERLSKVEMVSEDITHQVLVTEAATRVMRGGSFLYPPVDLRSANRNWVRPSYRNYNLGFRVARTLVVGPE